LGLIELKLDTSEGVKAGINELKTYCTEAIHSGKNLNAKTVTILLELRSYKSIHSIKTEHWKNAPKWNSDRPPSDPGDYLDDWGHPDFKANPD